MSYSFSPSFGFQQTGVFSTTPTGSKGGIWQAGRAPAIGPDGRVFFLTGNGEANVSQGRRNYGNSLLALDPVTLAVRDYFTPHKGHADKLNGLDLDFGGSGPMIIPDSQWIIGGGKQGLLYTWNLNQLGGEARNSGEFSAVQQLVAGPILENYCDMPWINTLDGGIGCGYPLIFHPFQTGRSTHAGHIMGGPVYWKRSDAAGGSKLYIWPEDSRPRVYHVQPNATPPIGTTPLTEGRFLLHGHPGGILSLSADEEKLDSGIVWASGSATGTDTVDAGALHRVRPGRLHAYAASDLRQLWADEFQWDFAKFTPPTIANGKVYMATFSNKIVVYGLLPQSRIAPRLTFSEVQKVSDRLQVTVFAADPVNGTALRGAVTISGRGRKSGAFTVNGSAGQPIDYPGCFAVDRDCVSGRVPRCVNTVVPSDCKVDVDVPGWAHAVGTIAPIN